MLSLSRLLLRRPPSSLCPAAAFPLQLEVTVRRIRDLQAQPSSSRPQAEASGPLRLPSRVQAPPPDRRNPQCPRAKQQTRPRQTRPRPAAAALRRCRAEQVLGGLVSSSSSSSGRPPLVRGGRVLPLPLRRTPLRTPLVLPVRVWQAAAAGSRWAMVEVRVQPLRWTLGGIWT